MSKYFHQCICCDTSFESKRPDAKYCSNACRQYEYRRNVDFRLWHEELQRIHELNELKKAEANRKREEEAKAKAKAQQEALVKFYSEKMKENIKRLESFKLEMDIQRANYRLENWLEGISDLCVSRKYDTFNAHNLFSKILAYKQQSIHQLPLNYKYANFINNILIPSIEEFVDHSKGRLNPNDLDLLTEETELKVKNILDELKKH
jgi:hypothetical protein